MRPRNQCAPSGPPYWGKSSIAVSKWGAASGAATVPEQGLPEGHAGREAAGIPRDRGLQRGDVGDEVGEGDRRRRLRALLRLSAHRPNRRREPRLQEIVEIPVEVVEVDPQCPLERLLIRRPVTVRMQHFHDGREPVPLLDHLEDQRRLVVAVPHLARVARVGEPPVQFADRTQFASCQGRDEAHPRLVAPTRIRDALLVHRQPFGEPPRHLAVGNADVEGVRDLVPERRGPVEVPPVARRGRIHGQRGPEAHPQRPDPHQPDGAHREIGVTRVDLNADGYGWRVIVPRRTSRARRVRRRVRCTASAGRPRTRGAPAGSAASR